MPWPFYLFLFLALWQGIVCIFRAIYKNNIKVGSFITLAAAIVGCVYFVLEK